MCYTASQVASPSTCMLSQVSYDKSATEVDLLQPAFTRRREVFVGRLAMVGFVSAVLGEVTPPTSFALQFYTHLSSSSAMLP